MMCQHDNTDPCPGRLLIVDDDPDSLRLLGQLLRADGYRLHVADSGERGLEVLAALEQGGAEPVDLILLDVLMPAGMDGIETCRHIKARAQTAGTPVLFLTGKDDEATTLRAFNAGGADYVLKPVAAEVLRARVRTQVRLARLSRQMERALAERSRALHAANHRLRRLASEIALVEERERKRLASDLHDSPMQKLNLAQMQIVSAARRRDAESDRLLEVGLELLRDALAELRSLQFELSPPLLYQDGLTPALHWLTQHLAARSGIVLEYMEAAEDSDSLPNLPDDLAVALFQSARELLYNLIKHSGASQGEVRLGYDRGWIALSVSDNGRGFDAARCADQTADQTADQAGGGGFGLLAVRERLRLWQGRLDIASTSTGARVTAMLPWPSTNH